jgi:hypothetical protein
MRWKKIPELPGYEASDSGHIRCAKTKTILAENVNSSSSRYLRVTIGKKHYLVHRLVAKTFLQNPKLYAEVDHINRDKTDNSAKNLRWVSHLDNMRALAKAAASNVISVTPKKRRSKYGLSSRFNAKKHKAAFHDYLEVIITKTGRICYAVPSHQEALVKIGIEKHKCSREEYYKLCPEQYMTDYTAWLCIDTECIAVWNDFEIGKPNKKQAYALKMLRFEGLYKGNEVL